MNCCAVFPCFIDHLWFTLNFCFLPCWNLLQLIQLFVNYGFRTGNCHCLGRKNRFVHEIIRLIELNLLSAMWSALSCWFVSLAKTCETSFVLLLPVVIANDLSLPVWPNFWPWQYPITINVPIIIHPTFLQHVNWSVCPPDNVNIFEWDWNRAFLWHIPFFWTWCRLMKHPDFLPKSCLGSNSSYSRCCSTESGSSVSPSRSLRCSSPSSMSCRIRSDVQISEPSSLANFTEPSTNGKRICLLLSAQELLLFWFFFHTIRMRTSATSGFPFQLLPPPAKRAPSFGTRFL